MHRKTERKKRIVLDKQYFDNGVLFLTPDRLSAWEGGVWVKKRRQVKRRRKGGQEGEDEAQKAVYRYNYTNGAAGRFRCISTEVRIQFMQQLAFLESGLLSLGVSGVRRKRHYYIAS